MWSDFEIFNPKRMDSLMNRVISVIMPVFNCEVYLRDAIESVLNQTFTSFEFIIINDGSTDNSKAIIKSYSDSRIVYVENESNIGLIASLNKAILIARGTYIARMDADDISLPNRFLKQFEFLEANPNHVIVGSSAIFIDCDSNFVSEMTMPSNHELIKTLLFFNNTFVHTSIMGQTRVFKEFMYSSDYYLAEDYFLWSQISEKYRLANISDPLVKYRIHQESVSIKKRNEQEKCVKKIYNYHLSSLGIKTNENILNFHYDLISNLLNLSTEEKEENFSTLKWVRMLRKHNAIMQRYPVEIFDKYLQKYWTRCFHFLSSFNYGFRAVPFAFDRFNEKTGTKAKILFVVRCIKKELSKLCPKLAL